MNKKLILASLLCVGALVGCGVSNDATAAPETTVPPTSDVETPTTSEEVETPTTSEEVETPTTSEEVETPTTSEEVKVETDGTLEAPLTVSEAYAITEALGESDYKNKVFSEKVVFVTGTVTSVLKKDAGWTAVITDGTKEFTVYGGLTKEGVDAPVAGDIVIASGHSINFRGTFELSENVISDTETVSVYYENVKHVEYAASITLVDLEGVENQNATVTGLASKVNSGTVVEFTIAAKDGFKVGTVTVNDSVVPLKDGKYTFVATDKNVVKAIVVTSDTIVPVKLDIKPVVSENTSANALEGDALATALNLDPTVFTVTYNKGDSSNRSDLAIRTDGLRLYAMDGVVGNSLEFTLKDANAKFDTINISFNEDKYAATAKVLTGETEITALADGTYEINANSFKIVNDNTEGTKSSQVRFTNIAVSYLA